MLQEKVLGEDELKSMLDELKPEQSSITSKSPEILTKSWSLIKQYQYYINAIALSDDGQALYVGTAQNVQSYEMKQIRDHVRSLPSQWKDHVSEKLTGLQYRHSAIYCPSKNYLQRVELK